MTPRSSRAEVRNPVLAMPAMRLLGDLPADSRAALADVLANLSLDAAERANQSWRKNKGPMAAYWKAVSVYAKHIGRAVRHYRGPARSGGLVCPNCAEGAHDLCVMSGCHCQCTGNEDMSNGANAKTDSGAHERSGQENKTARGDAEVPVAAAEKGRIADNPQTDDNGIL